MKGEVSKERCYQIILGPHISEKGSASADASNRVVFRVTLDATKFEIKKAIELLFEANVQTVQTLRVRGKVKRNRYGLVKKSSWKKAYVRVSKGQGKDISFAAVE